MKSKLTNAVVLALAIFGGIFILLVVVVAITDSQDTGYTPNQTAPTYSAPIKDDTQVKLAPSISDSMASNWERVFVDSCSTEANRSACQCMYDYLDSHLTNDQFENLDINNDPIASAAVLECYDK
jgi:hypothetical protein